MDEGQHRFDQRAPNVTLYPIQSNRMCLPASRRFSGVWQVQSDVIKWRPLKTTMYYTSTNANIWDRERKMDFTHLSLRTLLSLHLFMDLLTPE